MSADAQSPASLWRARLAAWLEWTSDGARDRRWLRALLTGYAFFVPLWIGGAQFFGYAAAALTAGMLWRRRGRLPWRACATVAVLLWVFFSVAAAVAGPCPNTAVRKLNRLFLLFLLWAPEISVAGRSDRGGVWAARWLGAFVVGATVRGAADIVRILAGARRSGWEPAAVFDLGNMRDPQFYLSAALILIAAGCGIRAAGGARRLAAAAIALVAMVLHFKRGVWLAFAVSASALCLAYRRRVFVVLAAAGLAALALPTVRARLAAAGRDLSERSTRVKLWVRVAPVLIRRHPWGMGRGALRNTDIQNIARIPETKINHLHNNLLQIAVESGWGGAAAWLVWMFAVGADMARNLRRSAAPGPRWIPIALGAVFLGLHLNGLIECNFGDSEIYMWFLLLIGLSNLWRGVAAEGGAAQAPVNA